MLPCQERHAMCHLPGWRSPLRVGGRVLRRCGELWAEVSEHSPGKCSRVVLLRKQKAVQAGRPINLLSSGRCVLTGGYVSGMNGKVQEIHITPPLAELSGASEDLTLGSLEFTYKRKILQQPFIPACWREHPAGSRSSSEEQSSYRSPLHAGEPEPCLCHGNRSCLHATKRSVRLMLLCRSRMRIHMPYEAVLTRWYGSTVSSSKKMSSPSLLGLQLAVVYPTMLYLYWVKFREKYCWKLCQFG